MPSKRQITGGEKHEKDGIGFDGGFFDGFFCS
jgi:hypothetical protein